MPQKLNKPHRYEYMIELIILKLITLVYTYQTVRLSYITKISSIIIHSVDF